MYRVTRICRMSVWNLCQFRMDTYVRLKCRNTVCSIAHVKPSVCYVGTLVLSIDLQAITFLFLLQIVADCDINHKVTAKQHFTSPKTRYLTIKRLNVVCQFGMDICQMGICVHSKWTYVRLEFMSIRNGHVCQIGIVKIIR